MPLLQRQFGKTTIEFTTPGKLIWEAKFSETPTIIDCNTEPIAISPERARIGLTFLIFTHLGSIFFEYQVV